MGRICAGLQCNWGPKILSFSDMEYAETLEKMHGKVLSFDSDLSAFRQSGGKIITYHGISDAVISSEISMRF